MIKYLFRHNKDYSRFNVIKEMLKNVTCKKDIYILLPFSKNQFIKNFFKRKKIINDFFISNYDTYVNDRKKISKYNPRAWWKYMQDYINFKFSYFLLSDTKTHFEHWESMFGKFKGRHFVLPVLADKNLYFPAENRYKNDVVKILFYGSFAPLHGIDIILDAFAILENEDLKFKAEIIGNGQTFKQMKIKLENLKIKNLKMDGDVIAEKDLAQKIREHDIILGIFGDSKKARSVVANKVYQGIACAKTVVTMKSAAIDEFFDEEDLIQCENNAESLAKTLKNLIQNTDLIDKYAKQGYKSFVKLYDTTKMEFIDFIKKVDGF